MTIRVVVAEDSLLVREGIAAVIALRSSHPTVGVVVLSRYACPGGRTEPLRGITAAPPHAPSPDQPGDGLMTFEPGRYVAACFVPPEVMAEMERTGKEPEGPPHAMQGMVTEFTVA